MSAIFVTGATGLVGSAVTKHLLDRGETVVGAVRSDADAARLPDSATARLFDFAGTTQQLDAALDGIDRVFLMRPPAIEDVQRYLFPFIDACLNHDIRQIVFLSLQGVQGNRKTPHYAVEQYLKLTDAPYTSLRPNFFMQNLSGTYADEIRERGEIIVPAGRAFTAFIDARDIGRVAATVLTEPGHERKAYTLSGEQSLRYARVATIMTRVLGRPIRYTRPSENDYLALLADKGYPDDYIAVQKMIYRVVRLNISAFPNRMIRKLTGRPATRFEQFVQDYSDSWHA
ncbi:SDR family oxidoreductase [Leifsonia sp. YIM 134122]|uniref:SDR family oxidoreductase n=1 Tax=Leifsonia stereocauli TaxID=3134136 RepID=A0ABU9W1R7_9MICO